MKGLFFFFIFALTVEIAAATEARAQVASGQPANGPVAAGVIAAGPVAAAQPITPDWYRVTKDDLYLVSWKLARLPWLCETTASSQLNEAATIYADPQNCLTPKLRELARLITESTRKSELMIQMQTEIGALAEALDGPHTKPATLSPKELRTQTRRWQSMTATTIVAFDKLSHVRPGEAIEIIRPTP